MKEETTDRTIVTKTLEPADLKFISGGAEEIFAEGDLTDEKDKPGNNRKPNTRYPPCHMK